MVVWTKLIRTAPLWCALTLVAAACSKDESGEKESSGEESEAGELDACSLLSTETMKELVSPPAGAEIEAEAVSQSAFPACEWHWYPDEADPGRLFLTVYPGDSEEEARAQFEKLLEGSEYIPADSLVEEVDGFAIEVGEDARWSTEMDQLSALSGRYLVHVSLKGFFVESAFDSKAEQAETTAKVAEHVLGQL